MNETLWPARNVAEYAYCPRLFYYMEVEGIHLPSNDTLEGVRIHRRVDAPSADPQNDESRSASGDADRPRAVRSLTLTSARLGLTATLDLAEITGSTAIPVEYRKGRPRHVDPVVYAAHVHGDAQADGAPQPDGAEQPEGNAKPEGDVQPEGNAQPVADAAYEPWPTDRVHVGLQAILLEESGYTVPHGILYYAAEKRRLTVPFDDALRQEALGTLVPAKACAAGPRPLPLVNDPRCPRCSLQPICLPDEVNAQRGVEAADGGVPLKPRKLWPPRDDGTHVIAQQNGTKVGVRGATLTVTDKNGAKLKEMPLAGVESLALLGSVQISTQAIQTLADRGIPVALLTAAGRLVAMVDPLDSVSAETRRAQVRKLDDPVLCLELSAALVAAKIANQRKLLMRNVEAFPEARPRP